MSVGFVTILQTLQGVFSFLVGWEQTVHYVVVPMSLWTWPLAYHFSSRFPVWTRRLGLQNERDEADVRSLRYIAPIGILCQVLQDRTVGGQKLGMWNMLIAERNAFVLRSLLEIVERSSP